MRLDGVSSTSEDAYSSTEEDFLSRIVQSSTAESSGCGSSSETNKLLPSVGHVMREASTSLRRGWSQSRKLTTSLLDLVTDKCKILIVLMFMIRGGPLLWPQWTVGLPIQLNFPNISCDFMGY